MGLWKDKTFDVIVLIDGDQESDDGEWKGLTQTMKKVVVKALEELNNKLNSRFNDNKAFVSQVE
jgi:hypothetical protein